ARRPQARVARSCPGLTMPSPTATKSTTPATPSLSRRELLSALRAFKRGEFDVRLRDDLEGIDGSICETVNELVARVAEMEEEFAAMRVVVGRDGRTRRRLRKTGIVGGWAKIVASTNDVLEDLATHTDDIARVVTAVSRGDLSQTIDLDGAEEPLRGDFLKHAKAVNGMVEQLSRLGSEVTRVAQEVGVDGRLGAQARVPGVSDR